MQTDSATERWICKSNTGTRDTGKATRWRKGCGEKLIGRGKRRQKGPRYLIDSKTDGYTLQEAARKT